MTNDKNNNYQEYIQKELIFYKVFLSAWVKNKMEFDRWLIILSLLGFGFLYLPYKSLNNEVELVLWLIAETLFLATIILVLLIFSNNTKYIEYLISNKGEKGKNFIEKKLQAQTVLAFCMFVLAVIAIFILVALKEVGALQK